MLSKTGPKAILARFSCRSSHKFEPAVCIERPMYTTQSGRIQIFDQLSAHLIKTASSSTAKSFVKYCLVLQCKKILHLIARAGRPRMTKNVGAFSLSAVCSSRNNMTF